MSHHRASERLGSSLGDRDARMRALFWGLALGIVLLRVVFSFHHLTGILSLPGPNSLGEAGKVFFAREVMQGRWPFASGLTPPYYPSIHGVLPHALVGTVGALVGLDVTGLYYAGRAISVAATLWAFGLFWSLGRRIGGVTPLLVFCLLLWAGSLTIFQHTTSFRPDNWLLGLSLLACWLVAVPARSRARIAALVVLPVIAFHVKATGLVVGAAVVAGLAYRDGFGTAMRAAMGQAALVTVTVLGLQWASAGTYLEGLGAAGSADFSVQYALSTLWTVADPTVTILLAGPILVAAVYGRLLWRESPVATVVAIFWAVTLGGYFLAASRAGSNSYYFLEPAAYGSLVILAALARTAPNTTAMQGDSRGFRPVATTVLLLLVPVAVNLAAWVSVGRYMSGVWNYSIERTEQVGGARLSLAEALTEEGMSCFTDDPGLNVLLRHPRVIYPYLQSQMMETGALPRDLRLTAIRNRTWDCVVTSRWTVSYHGTTSLPDTFFTAVRQHYPNVAEVSEYEVRLRP